MEPLKIDIEQSPYRALIGTGGIGFGSYFALNGNQTLGREESRTGHFIDKNDYCKLHIIAHYVQTLIGPRFSTLPISYLGDDAPGQRILTEMANANLNLQYVTNLKGGQTLYSICLIYPDGSGGNLTVDNSVCSRVDPTLIQEAETDFIKFKGKGIALAVPEVPLTARTALLEFATKYGFLRAASFTSEEMRDVQDTSVLSNVDLLSINIDEATVLAGMSTKHHPSKVVKVTIETLQKIQPTMWICITAGVKGNWLWDGENLKWLKSHKVKAAGTAGAGDAFFAGILVGIVAGLQISEAHELGNLVAAFSVTSPHTIAFECDRVSLRNLAMVLQLNLSVNVEKLLED